MQGPVLDWKDPGAGEACHNCLIFLEARAGVEPTYTDLQSEETKEKHILIRLLRNLLIFIGFPASCTPRGARENDDRLEANMRAGASGDDLRALVMLEKMVLPIEHLSHQPTAERAACPDQ